MLTRTFKLMMRQNLSAACNYQTPRPTFASSFCILMLSLLMLGASARAAAPAAADAPDSPTAKQKELIALLQSKAPAADKALACKKLAIYGNKDAVRALAPLLTDKELASWARIALEAIPDPAADAALRSALGKVQGRLLVGVINSVGVRRDAKATSTLAKKLKAPDAEVASAAAVALGKIGGDKAAKALLQALVTAPDPVRAAAAEGAVLCGERFMAEGKEAAAVKTYDAVRSAKVPRQKQLEAIRGAILARQAAGLPLLLQQLRSRDKALFGIGLRTGSELPGQSVTEALGAELNRCGDDRQPFLLLALADRNDASVMPAVATAVNNGSPKLRLTAIGVLERRGGVANVAVLLRAAVDSDPAVAQAAINALTRLGGSDVDAELVRRLPTYQGKVLQVLLTLMGQRQIPAGLPAVMRGLKDQDAGIRGAAVQSLGILGTEAQTADLASLLQAAGSANERGDIKTAMLAIIGRGGAECVPALIPLARSNDSGVRLIALQLLASAGGPEALAAVQAAVEDKEGEVQDEAARTLSTWPNNWPEDSHIAEPLLALAKSGTKPTHQVLALRGYLQYVQGNKQLKDADKVSQLALVAPMIKRAEEKRLAIAAVAALPTARSLDLLVAFAEDPAVADDACAAIVKLVDPAPPGVSAEQRQKALQTAAEKASSTETKQKARKLLKAAK